MALKLGHATEPCGGLVKTLVVQIIPKISDSVGPEYTQDFAFLIKPHCSAAAAGPRTKL